MKLKCIFSCSMIKIHCPFFFLSQIFDFTKIISYTWSDFPIFQIKQEISLKWRKIKQKPIEKTFKYTYIIRWEQNIKWKQFQSSYLNNKILPQSWAIFFSVNPLKWCCLLSTGYGSQCRWVNGAHQGDSHINSLKRQHTTDSSA